MIYYKKLHIAERTYSGYETENRDLPTEFLISLALFYNTSTDYILGWTNIKKTYPKTNKKRNLFIKRLVL